VNKCLERKATAQGRCQTLGSSKVNWKN